MKERPILFSAPMVHAILSGQKTATRRLLKLLQTDGLVLENPTTGGTTRWWPVGLAAELMTTMLAPEHC